MCGAQKMHTWSQAPLTPACCRPRFLWQEPREASIALFSKDAIGLSFTLTWWAYFYLPAGLGPRIAALLPVRSGAKVARAILRANQIVQRVNAAVKLFPGLVGAPLVLGTLAGSGGKLLTDAFSRCAGYPTAGERGERVVCCGGAFGEAAGPAGASTLDSHHARCYVV